MSSEEKARVMWLPDYTYFADVVRVIDGDTVELSIDVGLDARRVVKCRLHGINAPERRKSVSAGEYAHAHLTRLCRDCSIDGCDRLIVRTHKDQTGKYGRYLAELIGCEHGVPINLNERMVQDGHAVRYEC